MKTLTDQIRDAVKASKLSHYRLCKETGIDKASFSRFMSGERQGLSTEAIESPGRFSQAENHFREQGEVNGIVSEAWQGLVLPVHRC